MSWIRLTRIGIRAGLGVVAAMALILAVRSGGGPAERQRPAAEFDPDAPNVVVVMTDDQALDTMRAMPRTLRLVGDRGVTYENAIVSYPLCCPSRATFLTGQYAHNHGVLNNSGPRGGYQRLDSERTLPVWLAEAGYRTGFVGKYLNGYGKGNDPLEVPPGWNEWYALPAQAKQRAFEFDVNENGARVPYRGSGRRYKTDLLADKARGFIRRRARAERPFFLWVATNGPHKDASLPPEAERNPEPAPRDRGRFEGERAPRRAAVDESDVSDKPRPVRELPRLGTRGKRLLDREYVSQLESLLSIDRLVARLVRELERSGELDRTLLVFTSDNGYLRGQHRFASGKSRLYEESIRVPLMIRGPGFRAGTRDDRLVSNADLAPTILAAGGAEADLPLDGRPLLAPREEPRDAVPLEVFERKHAFTGLRTERHTYVEYEDGERELYDLRTDPEQLDNLAGLPEHAELEAALAARLAELRDCVGAECG